MTMRTLFLGYMAVIGLASSAIVVAMPKVTEYWLKPYFWVLIAVALFDGGIFLVTRESPAAMLSMNARLIGFAIGIVLMGVAVAATGSPATLF